MNIEKRLISWLSGYGYDVYHRVPVERPDEFVTLQKETSSHGAGKIEYPCVAIQVWGTSDSSVSDTAEDIVKLIKFHLNEQDDISVKGITGAYDYFDDDSKTPRYQIVLDLVTTS